MAALTAYATGTIDSVAGTSVGISGGAVAGWVGRCIRLSTGLGAGQSRRITAVVSATQITIEFPFANTYTRAAMAALPDVDPVQNDGFVISSGAADIADGTSIILDPLTNSIRFVGASTFNAGAFLYLRNFRIDLVSTNLTTTATTEATRCAIRLGDIDAFGNVSNGCHLLDTATAPSGFNPTGGWGMDFEFYGGIAWLTGSGPFWRMHTDNNIRYRMIGARADGSLGGRMQGARSIYDELEVYNNQNASGPFNAKSAFGAISNIRISNSLQAVYHFWPDSLTLELEGIKLGPNVARGIRFANGTTVGQRLTIKDVVIPDWSALPILWNNANGVYANQLRFAQYVSASYVSAAGVPITSSVRFVLRDNVPTVIYDGAVTTGAMPKQTVRYRDMTVQNTGNYTWATAGGTTYAPYAVAAIGYLYQPAVLPLPLQTSQSVNLVALADTAITQVDKAVVDAYTTIDTLDQLYDRCKAWSVDNLGLAVPAFGFLLVNADGTELDFGAFNVTVDGAAASAFSVVGNTITIKSGLLANGTKYQSLRTTGTLGLTGGGQVGISKFTHQYGTYVGVSVVGLVAGSRIQLYNLTDSTETDNLVVADTSFFRYGEYTGDKAFRLRVTHISATACHEEYEAFGTFGGTGITFTVAQVPSAVYNANGIDGWTVAELAPDYAQSRIDISAAGGVTSVQRIYAWFHDVITTEDGIRYFFNGITALDTVNYQFNTAFVDLRLANQLPTPVFIVGGYMFRDDDTTVIASGTIQMDPKKAYLADSVVIRASLDNIETATGLIPALL